MDAVGREVLLRAEDGRRYQYYCESILLLCLHLLPSLAYGEGST